MQYIAAVAILAQGRLRTAVAESLLHVLWYSMTKYAYVLPTLFAKLVQVFSLQANFTTNWHRRTFYLMIQNQFHRCHRCEPASFPDWYSFFIDTSAIHAVWRNSPLGPASSVQEFGDESWRDAYGYGDVSTHRWGELHAQG